MWLLMVVVAVADVVVVEVKEQHEMCDIINLANVLLE